MDDPFRVLSRKEFDGLSIDEKLAYLDLELISQLADEDDVHPVRPMRPQDDRLFDIRRSRRP
jgi:hypothetical protein